jgi:glycosyltransferase involved in cell wall biosynthesis
MPAHLACAVLSLRNEPGLTAAVRSLIAQEEPVEVVVVNSGGRDPTETLREAGIEVPVMHREERLYVGGARNIGIEATQAPYVAFLAADCIAMPGWVGGRLRRHRAGALAVASSLVNAYPRSSCAWASYMLLHTMRMPGAPLDQSSRYSVSYVRGLFARFGRFREDLRTGEDTEFHQRLADTVAIAWAPDVRTAHRYPTAFVSLMMDQYTRGRLRARMSEQIAGQPCRRDIAWKTLRYAPARIRNAWRWAEDGWRLRMLGAWPLVVPAAVAYSIGALLSPWDLSADT